jgi:hypothetical protein
MLGKHGIFAFSPELGDGSPQSENFIISPQAIVNVLSLNYKIIE